MDLTYFGKQHAALMEKVLSDAAFIIGTVEEGRTVVEIRISDNDTMKQILIQRFETLRDVMWSSGYYSDYTLKRRKDVWYVRFTATEMAPPEKERLVGGPPMRVFGVAVADPKKIETPENQNNV